MLQLVVSLLRQSFSQNVELAKLATDGSEIHGTVNIVLQPLLHRVRRQSWVLINAAESGESQFPRLLRRAEACWRRASTHVDSHASKHPHSLHPTGASCPFRHSELPRSGNSQRQRLLLRVSGCEVVTCSREGLAFQCYQRQQQMETCRRGCERWQAPTNRYGSFSEAGECTQRVALRFAKMQTSEVEVYPEEQVVVGVIVVRRFIQEGLPHSTQFHRSLRLPEV